MRTQRRVASASLASFTRDGALSLVAFTCLTSGALTATVAGALLALGAAARPSFASGVEDAIEASVYPHAQPIIGARPNRARIVPASRRFMDHLLSHVERRP